MSDKSLRWIWQPDLGEGAELFAFRTVPGGYEARGDVVATLDGAPLNACYRVEADAEWRTRRVLVELNDGARVEMLSDGAGHWRREDGAPLPELDGCIDPDISMTPFTNTLPIRRLGLGIGDTAEIGVAYVLVPELSLRAAPQRYTRLGDRLWRFESLDSGFTADLTVDAEGLVVDYPGLFRRT
jgi:hypothetical protein